MPDYFNVMITGFMNDKQIRLEKQKFSFNNDRLGKKSSAEPESIKTAACIGWSTQNAFVLLEGIWLELYFKVEKMPTKENWL